MPASLLCYLIPIPLLTYPTCNHHPPTWRRRLNAGDDLDLPSPLLLYSVLPPSSLLPHSWTGTLVLVFLCSSCVVFVVSFPIPLYTYIFLPPLLLLFIWFTWLACALLLVLPFHVFGSGAFAFPALPFYRLCHACLILCLPTSSLGPFVYYTLLPNPSTPYLCSAFSHCLPLLPVEVARFFPFPCLAVPSVLLLPTLPTTLPPSFVGTDPSVPSSPSLPFPPLHSRGASLFALCPLFFLPYLHACSLHADSYTVLTFFWVPLLVPLPFHALCSYHEHLC